MRKVFLFLTLVVLNFQCKTDYRLNLLIPHKKFINNVVQGNNSFYALSKPDKLQKESRSIGIFDSGIGGLTVFDAIVNADFFNPAGDKQPDGILDFRNEQFIYFADQANMPYSNYVEEGKKDLLVEHVLKDALFLLNNKYHQSVNSPLVEEDKPNIKVMVIACNTATAYGKPQVEELCRVSGSDVKVIGVIDAGCKGALEVISEGEKATIAVLATPATVSSMAYVNTLNELNKEFKGNIQIIQQGGKGLHEAIDSKREFINSTYSNPFPDYQGPSLTNEQYRIKKYLLPWYKFDTTHNRMLSNNVTLQLSDTIQINSVENYARYHIVSLMEQLKEKRDTLPLRAIILGCTHYPYVSTEINHILRELKQTARYAYLLSDSINIIDPAINTAKELYNYLSENGLADTGKINRLEESRFFVSVPNAFDPSVEKVSNNTFTYDYQYKKRKINELKDYTLIVPLSRKLITDEQIDLIQKKMPFTYELLKNYESK